MDTNHEENICIYIYIYARNESPFSIRRSYERTVRKVHHQPSSFTSMHELPFYRPASQPHTPAVDIPTVWRESHDRRVRGLFLSSTYTIDEIAITLPPHMYVCSHLHIYNTITVAPHYPRNKVNKVEPSNHIPPSYIHPYVHTCTDAQAHSHPTFFIRPTQQTPALFKKEYPTTTSVNATPENNQLNKYASPSLPPSPFPSFSALLPYANRREKNPWYKERRCNPGRKQRYQYASMPSQRCDVM